MEFQKKILYILAFISVHFRLYTQQTDCSNIGFEKGNTAGWKLTTGTVRLSNNTVLYENETESVFENGVQISTISDGSDPKIFTQNIPTVASGGKFSIRIGNIDHGGRFDRIQTTFIPDPNKTIFLYKFAVILEDFANHSTYQKPGFNIKVLDENGLSVTCSNFDVQLNTTGSGPLKGFNLQGNYQYLNWTTGAIDLKNHVGKKLKIIVTAHGCTNRRHFGYAYFDAECVKAEITQLSKCPDKDGFLLLKAPEGFASYNWTAGGKNQIAKVKVKVGDVNMVKMLPYASLANTCEVSLDYKIPYSKTDTIVNNTICEDENVLVENEAFSETGKYIRTINRSNVCDSTVTLNLISNKKGRHAFSSKICEGEFIKVGDSTYTQTGNYITTIKRMLKCDSIVTSNILVDKKLNLQTNISYRTINIGDSLEFSTNINPNDNNNFLWFPKTGLSCSTCATTWAKPKDSGLYILKVSNPNLTCFDSDSLYIKVEPCQIHAPEIFTPNDDNQNNKFYIFGGQCVKIIKSLFIYNRWGELMYKAENFPASDPNFGWDGTYLGQQLTADIFPFSVVYELKDGKIANFKHAVSLIR